MPGPFDDDDDLELEIGDEIGDEIDSGNDGGEDFEQHAAGNRLDRKRARGRVREENETLREDKRKLEERLAALEARPQTDPALIEALQAIGRPQQSQVDPIDAQLSDVDRQIDDLQASYQAKVKAGTLTEQDKEDIRRRANQLQERKTGLFVSRTVREAQRRAPPPPQNGDVQQMLRARHADVYTDPIAVQVAESHFNLLRARGEPDSLETVDKAMALTRRERGMKPSSLDRDDDGGRPDKGSRSRFSGDGAGSSGRGAPKSIRMNKQMRELADMQYSHIEDPNKRYQLWANNAGKAYIAKSRGGR